MKRMFEQVKPKRLSDGAMEQVLALVREGKLPPGTKLPPERELIVLLKVSRTPLREAIRILETKGVLRVVPGRGTFVAEAAPPPELPETAFAWLSTHHHEVIQLLEMHEALEAKAAALAAERVTPAQMQTLRARLDDLHRAAEAGDRDGMSAADARLHAAIHEASGNEIIARFLGELAELSSVTRLTLMELPDRPKRVVAEHAAIVDAIERRDAATATEAVVAHVQRSKEQIRAVAAARIDGDRF